MCRWVAYSGSPAFIDNVLYKPKHSLIDQSLHSRMGVETTNGDGFGLGWYGDSNDGIPGTYHSVGPAWNNRNLQHLAAHIKSPLFFAHIRASTGTAIQETNCHPFQYDKWLWMHNGSIHGFPKIKRDLMMAIDPELFPFIQGSTDSEVMFYIALTFGLRDDPATAVARMAGLVESTAARHGIEKALQMTIATSDGSKLWGFRYSTEHVSRSLFYSTNVQALRKLYPDNEMLHTVSDESRLVVSEPFGELEGAWNAVPESMYGVIQEGDDAMFDFQPITP